MSLPSNQLDAFFEVARTANFSRAARHLRITQSALSQRVLNLEREIGTTLFIREPSGVRLTDVGQTLLRYCQKKQALEEDFQGQLGRTTSMPGRVRIAAFSTVMNSVVFPALDGLLAANPELQVEASIREVRHLANLLKQGAVDFIVTNEERDREGLKGYFLGFEESVLIRPTVDRGRGHIALDHDPDDHTTEDFFRLNKKSAKDMRRSYVNDFHGLLEGVARGWGIAVVPRHVLRHSALARKITVVENLKPLRTPVWLYHYEHPYYSKLELATIKGLTENAPELLRRV